MLHESEMSELYNRCSLSQSLLQEISSLRERQNSELIVQLNECKEFIEESKTVVANLGEKVIAEKKKSKRLKNFLLGSVAGNVILIMILLL
jgi:hypothetical protein